MTLRALIALAGLLPSLGTASPSLTAENWNAGLDTTQPGWYFEHPVWKDMKAKFQHRCDSIETVLRRQIPAHVDSIWTKDTARLVWEGKSIRWKTSAIKPDRWENPYGTALRPVLLRSRPTEGSPAVGLIEPGSGPWRIVREYCYTMTSLIGRFLGDPPDVGVNTDSVTAILETEYPGRRHPWNHVLLADSSGQLLGWAPWDSVVYFHNPAEAAQALPFYRDGLADLLDGVWWGIRKYERLDDRYPTSKFNPSGSSPGPLYRFNLRRSVFTEADYEIDDPDYNPFPMWMSEDPVLAKSLISEFRNPRTGKLTKYSLMKNSASIRTIPLHWFYSNAHVAQIHAFTTVPGSLGAVNLCFHPPVSEIDGLALRFNEAGQESDSYIDGNRVLYLQLDSSGQWKFRPQACETIKTNAEIRP
jgi:hypothetical protein